MSTWYMWQYKSCNLKLTANKKNRWATKKRSQLTVLCSSFDVFDGILIFLESFTEVERP